jgi:hypothetical protein
MTKAKRSFDGDGGAVAAATSDTHGTQRYRIGRTHARRNSCANVVVTEMQFDG